MESPARYREHLNHRPSHSQTIAPRPCLRVWQSNLAPSVLHLTQGQYKHSGGAAEKLELGSIARWRWLETGGFANERVKVAGRQCGVSWLEPRV